MSFICKDHIGTLLLHCQWRNWAMVAVSDGIESTVIFANGNLVASIVRE